MNIPEARVFVDEAWLSVIGTVKVVVGGGAGAAVTLRVEAAKSTGDVRLVPR